MYFGRRCVGGAGGGGDVEVQTQRIESIRVTVLLTQ